MTRKIRIALAAVGCFVVLLGLIAAWLSFHHSGPVWHMGFHRTATDEQPGYLRFITEGRVLWVDPVASLTSADVSDIYECESGKDDSRGLGIRFTTSGAAKNQAFTTAQVGHPIAILVEGRLFSAPVIVGPSSTDCVVSAPKTEKDISSIVMALKAGLKR